MAQKNTQGKAAAITALLLVLTALQFASAGGEAANESAPGENIVLLNQTNETTAGAENSTHAQEKTEDKVLFNETAGEAEEPAGENISANIIVKDSKNNPVQAIVKIKDSEGKTIKAFNTGQFAAFSEEKIERGAYTIEIKPEEEPIRRIEANAELSNETPEVIIEPVQYAKEKKFSKAYAIGMNFTTASVTATATGTELYKCAQWSFEAQQCTGEWELFKTGLQPGDEYTFELAAGSSAFGEIIATNAVHLGADYSTISNIYEQIKTKDNEWSEPIYENEFARVTFDQNLTNGRFIDIYARSNGTLAYIEFYEAGTNKKAGQSKIISGEELVFTEISGMEEPKDTFDMKIIKITRDPHEKDQCILQCEENAGENCRTECSTSQPEYDAEREAFMEFDLIHDDSITATAANGLAVYEGLNSAIPKYRTWNATNNFGAEQSALQTGTSGTDDITWQVVKAGAKRDEMILGTLDKGNDINIQVFNPQKRWDNLTEITANSANSAYQEFDIGYEQASGKALIVYENSATADSQFAYRIWNGTELSAETTFTTGLASAAIYWVQLIPFPKTDDIMVAVHNSATGLYAVPWNGTAMDTARAVTASTTTTSGTTPHFAFAWELSSGEGLFVYGEGNNLVARTYDPDNSLANYWSAAGTLVALGNAARTLDLCSAPTTDNIGIIWQTTNNRAGARVWDGTALLASPPSDDTSVENSGANNKNSGCTWTNSTQALFTYIDSKQASIDHFTFTTPNTWSVAAISSAGNSSVFGADYIKGLRLAKHPTTSEVMAVAMDQAETVRAIRWNGTAFQLPASYILQTATEALNGDQQSANFDWYRYDPAPNITNINPSGTTYSPNAVFEVNATIADNTAVGSAHANITLPNGTTTSAVMADANSDQVYNITFSTTSLIGTYTITVTANDTSTPQKTNSATATFYVLETTKPNVTGLIPAVNSAFKPRQTIQVSANVTDNSGISYVYANITLPNTTTAQTALSNSTTESYKYNASYTIPGLTGVYTLKFFANDTSGNINSTETTNFTVTDTQTPNITSLIPAAGSSYEILSTIEIGMTATDDAGVSYVYANITLPNTTTATLATANSSSSQNKYNISYAIPLLKGTYTIRYFANDSAGNINSTETTTFTATDTTKPNTTSLMPAAGSSYEIQSAIQISATARDNVGISNVYANITLPTGTTAQVALSNSSGEPDKYNKSYTVPIALGTFTVRIFANDTSGNINSTETTTFTAVDTAKPNVTGKIPASSSSYEAYSTIQIAANATDNFNISYVYANITLPNTTITTLALANTTTNPEKYNNSYTIPALLGAYTITFFANDTSGRINSTETTTFTAVDTAKPNVTSLIPAAAPAYEAMSTIQVGATALDNIRIDYVYANITLPDSTVATKILSNSSASPNKYNTSYEMTKLLGTYTIRIFANDSSGNINSTETATFTSTDTTKPNATITAPLIGSSYSQNETVAITATATDNVNLSAVYANITLPNTTIESWNMSNTSQAYNMTFRTTPLTGTYTIRIFANDTSGNINSTETRTFTIQDSVKPVVAMISPAANTYANSRQINFTCNASDAQGIANISFYSNLSGAYLINSTANLSGQWNITGFLLNTSDGTYIWNCLAFDASGNSAWGENFTLYADSTPPKITQISPNSASYNTSSAITINATITEAFSISTIYANITLPNGTITTKTMSDGNADNVYDTAFTTFNITGIYTIRIFANDSAGNINSSETATFTASDTTSPVISAVSPANSAIISVLSLIQVIANATDNIGISSVYANFTLPDSSIVQIALSNSSSEPNKYNDSYTIPAQTGAYTAVYFAQDTDGNTATSTITFTAVDTTKPNATGAIPATGATKEAATTIQISINATDNVQISRAYANATLPNGTITQIILSNSTLEPYKYNNSYTIPALTGAYTITFFANDTSGNINSTETAAITVSDTYSPRVTATAPQNSSSFNISSTIEISATITDTTQLSTIYANITLPNGTTAQKTLSNSSSEPNKYNSSYTLPAQTGNYTIRFFANDTSGNINSTETATISTTDSQPPLISALECLPANANLTQTVQCNATITDDLQTGSVWAVVTLPNGLTATQTTANTSSKYHFNFTTTLAGEHTARWYANDTTGNTNSTETKKFNSSDITAPSLSLASPSNRTNFSDSAVFTFNATDNYYALLNCSINIDGVTREINASAQNSTITSFTATGLTNANHTWNITCNDNSTNKNTSETRIFTTDTQAPSFILLNLTPSSDDDLDPNTNITFTANVTDNLTSTSTVKLMYKLSTETNYTNITMSYEAGFYNTTLNLTTAGAYEFKLWANDTLGNSNESNPTTKTIQYENTWTRTPSAIAPASTTINTNTTAGNITINNTGDYNQTFTLSSSSATTQLNTSTFNLTPKSTATVRVNETSSTGIKTFTITINSTGSPSSQATTGTIVSAPGEPVLTTTFTNPATDTKTVKRGESGVQFSAKAQNLGETTATNTTIYFTLPSGWTITFGSANTSAGDIEANSSYESAIEVTIPSGAELGEFKVAANASAFNSSGAPLAGLNLTFGSTITVTVAEATTNLGTITTAGSRTSSTSSGATGGSGGSSLKSTLPKIETGAELIESKEEIEIVRGEGDTFDIKITNIYPDTTLYDVIIASQGYISKYFTITPPFIEKLLPGESAKFRVAITSPTYLEEAVYDLSFLLTGRLESRKKIALSDGTSYDQITRKQFTENRAVALIVHEKSREETLSLLNEAAAAISAMKQAGITASETEKILKEAQAYFDRKNYKKAAELSSKTISAKNTAFEAQNLINEIRQQIKISEEKGTSMEEAKKLLSLATAAFSREDFGAALSRAKEAQISHLLLSKGKLNILWMLKTYWWAVLLIILGASAAGEAARRKITLAMIAGKIEDLTKEESSIDELRKELQEKAFREGEGSVEEYHKQMGEYEKRLGEISRQRTALREKRAGIIKISREIEQLKTESAQTIEEIKSLQDSYYNTKTISKKTYERKIEEYRARRAEIEKSAALYEAKLAKKEELSMIKEMKKKMKK